MGAYEGRHALIFAAAPETDYSYIRAFLGEHPDALIACADGGLRHARALGLHPDFMISDCDSMPETEGDEVIRLKPEKDDTDTQSCLREVFRRGCREATLVCATGGPYARKSLAARGGARDGRAPDHPRQLQPHRFA